MVIRNVVHAVRARLLILVLASAVIVLVLAATLIHFGSARTAPAAATASSSPVAPAEEEVSQDLPLPTERWTGDLDGMFKRRRVRALVVYSRSAFFYDRGRPRGTAYEALHAFQATLNRQFKTGNRPITVTFLPVGYNQLEAALTSGLGDLIAIPVAITPERQQKVAFSIPIATHVTEIVVTGPAASRVTSLDDLSGKEVFVNPLTVYYQNIQSLNKSLTSQGKKPIILQAADDHLGDEDLLEMVNAGLIPATVTLSVRAQFWAKVYGQLHLCSECVVSNDEELGWVMRKDEPQLKMKVDAFAKTHRMGTLFGNTLLRRYLQNTKWATDATSETDMNKFRLYVEFFKKYAAQYDFDYLMLEAMGYQESQLNQSLRSSRGAVGIMQVIPRYAAASPINIPNVNTAEPNIHAGAKMLRHISSTYFNDDKLDPLNRTLFTFAAYNAGPTRIASLRKKAASQGLNPDQWFGNVELVVAQNVGQETVQYVSDIYKYYVAYKLVLQQMQVQQKDEHLRHL